jgi:ABC-type transport system involved in cytochrome c biogenesis permease subunit
MKSLIQFLFFCFLSINAQAHSKLQTLAVQDAGRLKPFDTFARESLQLVYGKATFNSQPASEIVMTWLLAPSAWDEKEFVKINRKDIKEALKLEVSQSHFAPKSLFANERLPLLIQDLRNKLVNKEKLDPYFQDVQRLENQLSLYRALTMGMALRFVPPKEGDHWKSVSEMEPEWMEAFGQITKAFITYVSLKERSKDDPQAASAASGELEAAVTRFQDKARAENPNLYPLEKDMRIEVQYNELDPFKWAWILYLLGAIAFGAYLIQANPMKSIYSAGWMFTSAGFVLHIYGFLLRVYITGRPPVSNMYESVIWVSFGAILFGAIFELVYKKTYPLLSANIVGVICLIVASLAPNILDPSLQPLEPVLRSNMWLVVHVLTITLSYSAFFLALLMADLGLIYFLRPGFEKKANELSQTVYRVIQVGVVLLFAGTILGGVWADYSWGRFWGWDPKETWAFIAFMGYVAVLHAKKGGYIFNFGFLVSAIVAFSLVLMAWYGVNYVLGAGLHTYGFGGGGVPYVAGFIAIHFVYVVFVITVYRSRQSKKLKAT